MQSEPDLTDVEGNIERLHDMKSDLTRIGAKLQDLKDKLNSQSSTMEKFDGDFKQLQELI